MSSVGASVYLKDDISRDTVCQKLVETRANLEKAMSNDTNTTSEGWSPWLHQRVGEMQQSRNYELTAEDFGRQGLDWLSAANTPPNLPSELADGAQKDIWKVSK